MGEWEGESNIAKKNHFLEKNRNQSIYPYYFFIAVVFLFFFYFHHYHYYLKYIFRLLYRFCVLFLYTWSEGRGALSH